MSQQITEVVNVAPPKPIRAVPLRHPWRNIIAIALVLMIVAFVLDAAQREAYDWPSFAQYLFDGRVMMGAVNTIALTVLSMVLAVIVGIVVAIMRETTNPVLRAISFAFLWLFRGTPVYVQLVFWGLFTAIYQQVNVGIPFMEPWFTLELADVVPVFWIAVVGLGLNEAAYMAEIVRAGLLSVDRGQSEAADALGMGWGLRMRKVIIPQAMRVIIPPTGNELISMLKTTSLVTAVPFNYDLYTRARDISAATLNPIPLLMVASVWYLVFTSIMMFGQSRLERHFSRGQDARIERKRKKSRGASSSANAANAGDATVATTAGDATNTERARS